MISRWRNITFFILGITSIVCMAIFERECSELFRTRKGGIFAPIHRPMVALIKHCINLITGWASIKVNSCRPRLDQVADRMALGASDDSKRPYPNANIKFTLQTPKSTASRPSKPFAENSGKCELYGQVQEHSRTKVMVNLSKDLIGYQQPDTISLS